MLFAAVAEIVSLGSLLPFISAISSPNALEGMEFFNYLPSEFNVKGKNELVFVVTILFCAAVCVAASIRALQLWANTHLAYGIGADFSVECFRNTLQQTYLEQISRNSSVVKTIITKKVGVVIAVLFQFATLVSSVILSIGVILTLIIVNMRMTLISGAILGGVYAVIMIFTKRILVKNSFKSAQLDIAAVQTLQEGVGGVRDVILSAAQEVYIKNFSTITYKIRHIQAANVFIGTGPKFLMEALGILFIVASISYGTNKDINFTEALPLIGIFALGIQRLLPTFQQIFAAWAAVMGNKSAMIEVLELLNLRALNRIDEIQKIVPLKINTEISLNDISYQYADSAPYVLRQVNLQISKGDRIGLIGRTGSGKSTLVDILMGLLQPTEGSIAIDGNLLLKGNLLSWQKSIAHVPQNIFLTDATVAENIAFGINVNSVDMSEVIRASKQANLDEFIVSLPDGYSTMVGEAGIRFSGGQRQRLGLARALYRKSELLVLDEATSALDGNTESLVMQAIENLNETLTVIIIAHRISTLEHCNKIIKLENGQLMIYGSYRDYMLRK